MPSTGETAAAATIGEQNDRKSTVPVATRQSRSEGNEQTMTIRLVLLGVFSLMFLVFGLGFIFWPEGFTPLFLGVPSPGGDLMIDMRATYGGISLAVGLFAGHCAMRREHLSLGLMLAFLISVGLLSGRGVGLIASDAAGLLMRNSLILEALLTILYGWLFFVPWRLRPAGARRAR